MKTVLSALFAVGAFAGAWPQSSSSGDDDVCKRAAMSRMLWVDEDDNAVHSAAATDTDVLHYSLDIEIIPTGSSITGNNTMTVKSLVNNLTVFEFRLRSSFTISALKVDGINRTWTQISTTTASVNLGKSYNAGDVFTLYVAYSGVPAQGLGFGSITYTSQGGFPLVFTLSEPFYAYTWWPAKDENTDKATVDLRFTVPNTLTVVSNGRLISTDTVTGNKLKYYWKTDYPIVTYLVFFSAGRYNKFTGTYTYDGGTMPCEYYIYPGSDSTANRNAWLKSIDMLAGFGTKYGLFPFLDDKYGIYQFGFGGGMEHQTCTGQGSFGESLTAHEESHHWWGDNVTCAKWNDIWLNEGFATYSEAIWEEVKSGGSFAAYKSEMANNRPSNTGVTVYRYDISNVNTIFDSNAVYEKGAWVVHMLRHVLGDYTFFNTLAEYRNEFQGGSAITDDLSNVVSMVSGRNMAYFFNQWIYDDGAPTYQYGWKNYSVNGRNFVDLYIKQTQSASYPIFNMPIDVQATIGVAKPVYVVVNDAQAENLLFETSGTPTAIALDPDVWILNNGKSSISFVEGPPKVVALSPAKGSIFGPSQFTNIKVTFHKPVNATAADFSLVGNTTGAIPFTMSYDGVTNTATITPTGTLTQQAYTFTAKATITDTAAHKALDGEYGLPSGDGLPGGDFVMQLSVAPLYPANATQHNGGGLQTLATPPHTGG